jgi:hypothetical protein
MEFIAFGLTEGKMYTHFRQNDTFVLKNTGKEWGNDVVYGALFLIHDFDFYARLLDANYTCSLSTLFKNHDLDLHHRLTTSITPIHFNTLDELARLQYREANKISAQMYFGNPKHPKIIQRQHHTVSYRIVDGIDTLHFKTLFGEVTQ